MRSRNQRVRVTYHELLRGPPCRGDSDEQPADAADDQDRRVGLCDQGVRKTDEQPDDETARPRRHRKLRRRREHSDGEAARERGGERGSLVWKT